MTIVESILIAINLVSAAITCWYALCGINAATRRTPVATRISFAAIAVGSFAAGISPPDLDGHGIGNVLVMAGIAVGFIANRKKCVCLNCPARGGKREPAAITIHDGGLHA